MRRALLAAALPGLLAACATAPAPPAPAASCSAPPAAPGNVYVRIFDGVLTLPPGYVFEGNQVGNKTLFQGPSGAVRIGPRVELSAGYLEYAQATLQARERRCGLEILRHGDAPPLWLLLGKDQYALVYDQDPQRVLAMIDAYCASLPGSRPTP